jgi:hypothetical protein
VHGTRIPTSYRHPGEKYQHGGRESVRREHTLLTFPLSYIKVHPQLASESSIKVVYLIPTKIIKSYITSYIRLQSLPVSLRVSECAHHCLRPLLEPSPPLLPVQYTQSSFRTAATPIVCSFDAVTLSVFFLLFIPRTSACRVPEPYQSYPTSPPMTPDVHSAVPYSTTLISSLTIRSRNHRHHHPSTAVAACSLPSPPVHHRC